MAEVEQQSKKPRIDEQNGEDSKTAEKVTPIPENHEGFLPYLSVKDADASLELYKKAFDADVGITLKMPDGTIAHASLQVGRTQIMLCQENDMFPMKSAKSIGGCPMNLTRYVEDVDSAFQQAVDAGMEVKEKLKTHFYGDRMGTLVDPDGYEWTLGSRLEIVSEEVMQARMDEQMAEAAPPPKAE
ncbi:hypothetical protein NDN08_003025 [Rhodosorus marinus]|uniref:VOC domain-containing protein n=1 Tax=Rhodosorus marinus TaxID=101924 RepID=A0AAV8UZM9_9RHOD|nr:hypothetical protein NDN08_003025 [Rhodosorus marinus]